jgi:hypothetical protein
MITVFSNLLALIPINYAFVVQRNIIRGNLYLILFFASTFRHSLIEPQTQNSEMISMILDRGIIYTICVYNVYTRWILVFPYIVMFFLHKYYLSPNFGNYKLQHKIVHALGLHLAGAIITLKV